MSEKETKHFDGEDHSLSRPLVVGSWPGPGNNYVHCFSASLELVGISVVGIHRPWHGIGQAIDVLHIHWPEQIFWGKTSFPVSVLRAVAALASLAILRLRGLKLVWIVHNLQPHDADPRLLSLWRVYSRLTAYLVNGFVTLSPSTIEIVRNHFPGLRKKPATFVWQPKFDVQPSQILGCAWRKRHGIGSATLLLGFVGTIMPYKGAIELALVFTEVTNPNVRLVIAGQAADPEIRRRLCDIATRDRRILLNLQWLTDDELLETTAALDALMLPFNEILHSASIIYGLSCGKVIVTPETAFATDLQHRLGSQWIKTYKKPLSADVLSAIGKPPEHSALDLEFLSINESGLKLQRFYREILGI